ncbi:hypothetical protein [Streptomyces sp. NPDC059597]|uniref:hypothetical protein n=1 Tax=Streptomyces sp. NPDC059597 TaxID=3346879 RepID=UPI003694B86E
MPENTSAPRLCRDCDGFASVAITTGTRHLDGTRATLTVVCPTCKGTGHRAPALGFARVGR